MKNINDGKDHFRFSEDQQVAMSKILAWSGSEDKRMSLGGFAGTGKTTIISKFLEIMRGSKSIRVCAPTGKAAAVLRRKNVEACTLHKLIYTPSHECPIHGIIGKDTNKFEEAEEKKSSKKCPECGRALALRWVRVPVIDADIVIVDEASMLNQSMVDDVESLAKKILYVGDHGQLEPIGEDPGIMGDPDIRLEQIHRQAAQSGILNLAHHMRRGSSPEMWEHRNKSNARVLGINTLMPRTLARFDVVLCGYNNTRKAVNAKIRDFRGYKDPLPEIGETMICLKNDSDLGIYNGQLVTVTGKTESYEYPKYDFVDDSGNEYSHVPVHPDQFIAEKKIEIWGNGIGLFDYGYCITAHKSQGSEWDYVGVIEQLARSWDPARWRYTAATRAAKKLEYFIPKGRI